MCIITGEQAFLDKVRQYMMPRHRAFIEALSQAPSIREWGKSTGILIKVFTFIAIGAIQVLRNADGVGGVRFSGKKVLRRCKVQCY